MTYSTIPYFGLLSGTPVTWNGLEYAKILRVSIQLPWKKLAEGIVVCVLKTPRGSKGYWYDWLNLMTGEMMLPGRG